MDRKKNNKGIYNAFLYGAIGYAVVAVMFMAVGGEIHIKNCQKAARLR